MGKCSLFISIIILYSIVIFVVMSFCKAVAMADREIEFRGVKNKENDL